MLQKYGQPFLQLQKRILSILLRLVSVSLLFHFDSEYAREILFAVSAVYLFQVIAGLEMYLNPDQSDKEHLSAVLTTTATVLPVVTIYFFLNNLSLLWVLYFFVDTLVIERSKKQNVSNRQNSSNIIAITRSLIFLCATLGALLHKVIFLPIILIGSIILLCKTLTRLHIGMTALKGMSLFSIIGNVSFFAIAVALVNRSIDLALRKNNIIYDGFFYEFWDFFLSIFGIVNMVSFYLFIAPQAKRILSGDVSVGRGVYLLQPLIVLVALLIGLLYFAAITGENGQDYQQGIGVISQIYCVSVLMALFQVDSWRMLGIARSCTVARTKLILSFSVYASASFGVLCGVFGFKEYGLTILMALIIFSMSHSLWRWKSV